MILLFGFLFNNYNQCDVDLQLTDEHFGEKEEEKDTERGRQRKRKKKKEANRRKLTKVSMNEHL
jgi:hypothetical protein